MCTLDLKKGLKEYYKHGILVQKVKEFFIFYQHNARFKPGYEVLKPVYDGSRMRIIVPVISMQVKRLEYF